MLNYIRCKITNLLNINKIVTIHYYELDKDFSYNGESHNFWEMVYVDSGVVEINTNKKQTILKQGEIIFHKPNEFHTLYADKKTMTVPSNLKKHIGHIIEEYNETFFPMSLDDVKLTFKENPPIGSQQMIKTYLERLLILLIRYEQNNSLQTL